MNIPYIRHMEVIQVRHRLLEPRSDEFSAWELYIVRGFVEDSKMVVSCVCPVTSATPRGEAFLLIYEDDYGKLWKLPGDPL